MIGNCIKTGAVVNFHEWGTNVPCDVFQIADGGTYVFRFKPGAFYTDSGRKVTHEVFIGTTGFMDKASGIAVATSLGITYLETI